MGGNLKSIFAHSLILRTNIAFGRHSFTFLKLMKTEEQSSTLKWIVSIGPLKWILESLIFPQTFPLCKVKFMVSIHKRG